MQTKSTHGGKRTGSGRPKGEPHTIISFRVKSEMAFEIKNTISKWLKDIQNDVVFTTKNNYLCEIN